MLTEGLGRDGFDQMNLLYSEFPFKTGYIHNYAPASFESAPPDYKVRSHTFGLTDMFRKDTDIHPNDVARVQIEFDYTDGGFAKIKVWYRHPADTNWPPGR